MRRLSAEEIRDSMVQVTGKLNRRVGGESFFPVLDEAVLSTSSTKGGKWGNSSAEDRNRRSVYIRIKRSLKPPELVDFDFGDTDAPCPQRFVTTVPTQALGMLNGRFCNEQAAKFAARVREETRALPAQIERTLQVALSRDVSKAEIDRGIELVTALRKQHGLSAEAALDRFCLVALNLNEFLYLD